MRQSSAMFPTWSAPISRTRISVLAGAASTVRGSPISLFRFPRVALTRVPPERNTAESASLVVVLPMLPVMPTTVGASVPGRRSDQRARSCRAASGSSTTRVGPASGREATAATAPLRRASSA